MANNRPGMPRRKIFIINPKFQYRYIFINVGASVAICTIYYVAVRFFFWKLTSFGEQAGLPPDHVFYQFINAQVRLMNGVFAGTVVVTTTLLFFQSLFMSHRVAGPLYRLNQHMKGIAAGAKPTPVKFRKGDFFMELADSFNKQLEAQANKDKAA